MDISAIISNDTAEDVSGYGSRGHTRPAHAYQTRHGTSIHTAPDDGYRAPIAGHSQTHNTAMTLTPASTPNAHNAQRGLPDKKVSFHLLLPDGSHRARLPMIVWLRSTDRPEGIFRSLKQFWGLYEGQGISLEDGRGRTLIAQYENILDEHVYVRLSPGEADHTDPDYRPSQGQPQYVKPQLGDPIQMMPAESFARPALRALKRRDVSPHEEKGAYHNQSKPRGVDDEYSDSDGVSMTSSRRARSELPSTEISLENIVEGGRRKRAKFESSELPLFAPPQQPMTASISSMSPQRRFTNGNMASPAKFGNQRTFSYPYNQTALSPQSYGFNGLITPNTGSVSSTMATGYGNRPTPRLSGSGVPTLLPTPDPTVGSVISDEDVAWQLMRLGEASNMSARGRTSTSTLDDALSGKADATSASGDEEDRPLPAFAHTIDDRHSTVSAPARKKQKHSIAVPSTYTGDETSGEDYDDRGDGSFKGESDEIGPDAFGSNYSKSKSKSVKSQSRTGSFSNKNRQGLSKTKSRPSSAKIPPSPYSTTGVASRKVSGASTGHTQPQQQQPGGNDEDLSTKPRCQRCRKSKKGCDRQRPCQRCKDAGIGIEGCVSEDEGNGRKGRFGRHMGVAVPVGKSDASLMDNQALPTPASASVNDFSGELAAGGDAGKKRKR